MVHVQVYHKGLFGAVLQLCSALSLCTDSENGCTQDCCLSVVKQLPAQRHPSAGAQGNRNKLLCRHGTHPSDRLSRCQLLVSLLSVSVSSLF